jgi:hypothetical protein
LRENREFGARPERAQRCKADVCRLMPLALFAGKAWQTDDAKSEDRPDNHRLTAWTAAGCVVGD